MEVELQWFKFSATEQKKVEKKKVKKYFSLPTPLNMGLYGCQNNSQDSPLL